MGLFSRRRRPSLPLRETVRKSVPYTPQKKTGIVLDRSLAEKITQIRAAVDAFDNLPSSTKGTLRVYLDDNSLESLSRHWAHASSLLYDLQSPSDISPPAWRTYNDLVTALGALSGTAARITSLRNNSVPRQVTRQDSRGVWNRETELQSLTSYHPAIIDSLRLADLLLELIPQVISGLEKYKPKP